MKFIFDYTFYRIYAYFKSKNDNMPETKGSFILSLIQFLTILDLMTLAQLFYSFENPPKYYALIVLLLFGIINWYIYEHNFDEEKYDKQWENENKTQKTKRGWLVVIYLLGSFLLPVIYGILKHNLDLI